MTRKRAVFMPGEAATSKVEVAGRTLAGIRLASAATADIGAQGNSGDGWFTLYAEDGSEALLPVGKRTSRIPEYVSAGVRQVRLTRPADAKRLTAMLELRAEVADMPKSTKTYGVSTPPEPVFRGATEVRG